MIEPLHVQRKKVKKKRMEIQEGGNKKKKRGLCL